MIRNILITSIIFILIFTTGCSMFERIVYHPDINQGNYLTTVDIAKIHTGMTKKQVIYALGTSIMKDPFDSNIWYYVFRRKSDHESAMQQTLILTFNSNDILTRINNKPMLKNSNVY